MVWDFTDFNTNDIKKSLKLIDKLSEIGVVDIDDEMVCELEDELENREENIEECD